MVTSGDETEHEYTSRGFWLAKFPVTQEQWQALMKDNPTPSRFNLAEDEVKQAGITSTSLFPVEGVSWNDCQDFLGKMNVTARVPAGMGKGKFVLPHEDEWEYACRGGKGNQQPFYFGDRLNGDKANCDGNFPYGTVKTGDYKKRTTEVGIYEKLGRTPGAYATCTATSTSGATICMKRIKIVAFSAVVPGSSSPRTAAPRTGAVTPPDATTAASASGPVSAWTERERRVRWCGDALAERATAARTLVG